MTGYFFKFIMSCLYQNYVVEMKHLTYHCNNYNCIYNHRTTKTNQKYPSVNL